MRHGYKMFQYDLFKIDQFLYKAKAKKPHEEKPIGLMHPQETFGNKPLQAPPEGKPLIGKKPRHRDMSKLIPKVIREKVTRNGKVFFRNRTVFVKIEELPAHDKKVEIRLPLERYQDRFWIYWALKEYAGRVDFTEMAQKDKKNAIWRDKNFKLHYFQYKSFTEVPQKSILVYNNKLEEKVLLLVKPKSQQEEEMEKRLDQQNRG